MQFFESFHNFYGGVVLGVVTVAVIVFSIWICNRNFENNKEKSTVLGFSEAGTADTEILGLDKESH